MYGGKVKDGIVLLSIHVREQDDLLLLEGTSSTNTQPLLDNIGPVRIEQIDEHLMIVNSGWRIDGHALADKGRELCERYSTLYGKEKGHDFGSHIGWGLVDHLAECHVQETVRSLSTSGLLATCGGMDERGELYFIDICGLFPCRALAIGSHAKDINRCLERVDFGNISVQEGLDEFLKVLRNYSTEEMKTSSSSKSKEEILGEGNDGDNGPKWQIGNDSVVEVVLMKQSGNIIRKRVPFIEQ
eukprot:CAMPEP_0176500098 /NCGR_PEP_ID=MMETSP0200_2-20121128/13329_1 /TAXON_ID=947934 /ORGANISM="Chaetoceros sp., Strain GSL56" /LENGTH=242 /DNA_ID=CAMNT_0017898661 /DNA_START=205 /DNA_END=934 /DNA_ORIENTATION=-